MVISTSTHVSGTRMMNAVSEGQETFTRSGYLSIFTTPSVAKNGDISCFVPMVSHLDHSEHSVKIISEYGIADLRAKSPRQRAIETIINNVVHPDYRTT